MFSLVYARGAEWNESHWDNEEFNRLLIQARGELDEDRRAQMYHRMQALVSEDGGTIIPIFVNYIDVITDKIGHGEIASNRFLDGWKAVERWWLA